MTEMLRPRSIAITLVLVFGWCALWGTISVANLVSGGALAVAVQLAGLGTAGVGGVRAVPLVRLGWLVFVDLVRSTVSVAAEILTPRDHTDEAIIAVRPDVSCRQHLLLLVVAITLTPGTAVVDTDPEAGVLYLHVLHHDRAAATVEHVHELARLAGLALPVPATAAATNNGTEVPS